MAGEGFPLPVGVILRAVIVQLLSAPDGVHAQTERQNERDGNYSEERRTALIRRSHLISVHFCHEAPIRIRHPPDGGKHRNATIVNRFDAALLATNGARSVQ